jgi:hypothetical protein
VTYPVSSDKFSAQLAPTEQRTGTQAADRRSRSTPEALAGYADERADVDRAHRRLSQETERSQEPAIRSADEARRRISGLKALLTADPRAALDAHGRVDTQLFEAAMARPTA